MFRLRSLITKYHPSILPPVSSLTVGVSGSESKETILQNHLERALEAVWNGSNNSWATLMEVLTSELNNEVMSF